MNLSWKTTDGQTFVQREKGALHCDGKVLTLSVACPFEFQAYEFEGAKSLFELIDPEISNWKFVSQSEGTLLRVFWHYTSRKWHVITTSCRDAFSCYWGSNKSFGTIFNACLKATHPKIYPNGFRDLTRDLNKHFVYYFYLDTTEDNYVVLPHRGSLNVDFITYIGKMPINTQDRSKFLFADDHLHDLGYIKRPAIPINRPNITKFDDYANVNELVPMAIHATHRKNGATIKIWNSDYYAKYKLRDNEPFLPKRFLTVTLEETASYDAFVNLYPEHMNEFRAIYHSFRLFCYSIALSIKFKQITEIKLNTDPFFNKIVNNIISKTSNIDALTLNDIGKHILRNVNWRLLRNYL